MTAKEAIDVGYSIAEQHEVCLQSMAKEFYPDIPLTSLAKLVHGNKVWLAAEIMKAMQMVEV